MAVIYTLKVRQEILRFIASASWELGNVCDSLWIHFG